MEEYITIENGDVKINVFKVVQTESFQGKMAVMASKSTAEARRRLKNAGYKLPTDIWSGEKLASEYRRVLMKESREPAVIRHYIQDIGDKVLKGLADAAALELQAQKRAEEAPKPKKRAPRKPATAKKKEA